MAWLFWLLTAPLFGCMLVYRFSNFAAQRPKWAAGLLIFGAGTPLGIGLASCIFFLARLIVPGFPSLAMWIEIVSIVGLGYEVFRKRKSFSAVDIYTPFPLNLLLILALVVAIGIVTSILTSVWDANPHGYWDAWSIWNLRARFLASTGDLVPRTWSPILASTHPEYPLLTSGFIARCWVFSKSYTTAVPIAMPYLFLLAMIGFAVGGLSMVRSRALGLLLALVLVGTPALLHEVSSQYADVPLACYFFGALMLALLDQPVLAGAFAGFAGWTKDEGLFFLVIFLIAALIFRREQILRLAVGALPGGLLAIFFRLALARGNSSLVGASLPGIAHRITDFSRYTKIAAAFGHEFIAMSSGWYHPVLPLLVLAFALRFDRDRKHDMLFCTVTCVLLFAGYAAIYVITPNDLAWQLDTSLNRLFVQLWPIVLLAVFAGFRAPESFGAAPANVGKRHSTKERPR